MKVSRPIWWAVAAAVVGSAILAVFFRSYWPATSWPVVPRAQLLAKANQVSGHFGVTTSGWNSVVLPSVALSLARYARQHPQDSSAQAISPLTMRIDLSARHGDGKARVVFDSAGRPISWRAPKNFKPQSNVSQEAAATAAFRYLAGSEINAYGNPVKSVDDDSDDEDYIWKKPLPAHSEIRDRIKVVMQASVVKSADRKVYLASDDDNDSDSGDGNNYWSILDGLSGLLSTMASIAIFAIYILWLMRKSVSHKFPLRIGAAACVLLVAIAVAKQTSNTATIIFVTITVATFAAVGRGISVKARAKWLSVEQLCLLAPLARSAGGSLAAGLLFSPLLVAVPFLVAGCGLFPGSSIVPRNMAFIYSRSPLLESINMTLYLHLLGFFGFAVPLFQRLFRRKWIAWLFLMLTGLICFADNWLVLAGPLGSSLTAGFLILVLFWLTYVYFDLLAVLTLQLAGGFLLTLLIFAQKGGASGSLFAALGVLAIVAYWFSRFGKSISEGDPLATTPTISGFRAEREKLRAEFSVARRAQQDMLPQIPPTIPGYSIAASCTPSLEVGGDLYDFLELPDGRIGFGVADVSGKGVPAALYMTLTKGLLAAVAKDSSQLSRVVEEVNRHLHSVTRKKVFVTMALGFLDAEKRLLECVRAGHNPMVWRQTSSGETKLVAPGGLGLGITAGRIFATQLKVEQMALKDGDAVVFYSDGITEAMNSALEQFGEQRLMDAVERTDSMDAANTRDAILTEVRTFLDGVHPQDDMTLVVLRVGEQH